ncbi:MAG TPA: metal-dependent hydrolase [Thermotogota bacterium]|nr:metal-dependent hydrolase [Thermotogota bacterium]HRW91444.1 metal-dependent hydrolase [Thermotogota bacterium]
MPSARAHVASGLLLYPLALGGFLAAWSLTKHAPLDFEWWGIGYVVFVLSSDAPDVDLEHAIFHRVSRVIVWLGGTWFFFLALVPVWSSWAAGLGVFSHPFFLFCLGVLAGWFGSFLFSKLMPGHRGPLHTIWAALVYCLVIMGVQWVVFEKRAAEPLALQHVFFLGTCAFLGYALHLALDRIEFISRRGRSKRRNR